MSQEKCISFLFLIPLTLFNILMRGGTVQRMMNIISGHPCAQIQMLSHLLKRKRRAGREVIWIVGGGGGLIQIGGGGEGL